MRVFERSLFIKKRLHYKSSRLNGDFYDVKVHEQINAEPNNPSWYKEAFSEFKKSGKNLQYSATYHVPKKLIEDLSDYKTSPK